MRSGFGDTLPVIPLSAAADSSGGSVPVSERHELLNVSDGTPGFLLLKPGAWRNNVNGGNKVRAVVTLKVAELCHQGRGQ